MSYIVPVKSKVKISQTFVAFSEYMNFKAPSPALKVIVLIDYKNSYLKKELGVYGLVEHKLCCLCRQAILKVNYFQNEFMKSPKIRTKNCQDFYHV